MFRRNRLILTSLALGAVLFGAGTQATAQLDPTFGVGGVQSIGVPNQGRQARATFVLPGDKLLVMHNRTGDESYALSMLNADGSVDTSYGTGGTVYLPMFASGTGSNYAGVYGVTRQPDGKIILAGGNGTELMVARLNVDGSLDTTFGGTGTIWPNLFTNSVELLRTARVLPDGKIMVMGDTSSTANGHFFLRINADGTIDNTFGGGQPVFTHLSGGQMSSFELQPSGKMLLKYGGRIARFNADGSADPTFNTNTTVYRGLKVLPDGKFLASHLVSTVETFDRTNNDAALTKFNEDGSPDTSFGTGGTVVVSWARYVNETGSGIVPLPDGRILLGGSANVPGNRSLYKGNTSAFAIISSTGVVEGKMLSRALPAITPFNADYNTNLNVLSDGKIVGAGTVIPVETSSTRVGVARFLDVPMNTYNLRPSKFDFAYSNAGFATRMLFRPSNSTWYPGPTFGQSGDVLVPDDYLGAGFGSEFAVFRPSSGKWLISRNPLGDLEINALTVQFGMNGDVPVQADYDGDLKADIAVFRPTDGSWHFRNSTNEAYSAMYWGLNGDKPVQGDYDGDGLADVGVFRPSNGTWYINKSAGGVSILEFGINGDIPVNDDYDGDGKTDIAVFRPSTSVWYIINSSDGSFTFMPWGTAGDVPVPADYDGDAKTDVAIFRPSTGIWYTYQSTNSQMHLAYWGLPTDIAAAARQ